MDDEAVIIRAARSKDARAIASVHVRSSQSAYAPLARDWPVPDLAAREAQWLRWLELSEQSSNRIDLVAERSGSVVALLGAGPARRQDEGAEVEVYVIHVLPSHRGQGIGGLLWNDASRRLRGDTLLPMYVDTLAELRCCSFYEARGGQVARRRPRMFHGGVVNEVVYVWPSGHASELLASASASRAER